MSQTKILSITLAPILWESKYLHAQHIVFKHNTKLFKYISIRGKQDEEDN